MTQYNKKKLKNSLNVNLGIAKG